LSNSLQEFSLNLMASMVGNLHFLTQFIKSHSFLLVDTISWILLSKNNCLAILTIFQYLIQSILFLGIWYVTKSLLYSSFYHTLKCLYQSFSVMEANSCIASSSLLQLWILVVLIQLPYSLIHWQILLFPYYSW